jgi:hypothetical protein
VEPVGLTAEQRAQAALSMEAAAAAVREVLKFIPPGAERMPLSAIWTDRGRAEFAREPARMGRARMAVLETAYRESAARLAGDRALAGDHTLAGDRTEEEWSG